MIRAVAIFLIMNVIGTQAYSHNAKISTFTLRDTGAGWIIEMAFAQASVDVVMERALSRLELETLTKDEYKDKVVRYVREHFNLVADGENIPLSGGGIMLGNHETNLKFVLPEINANPISMSVNIPMFGTTYNHTNIFRIYRGGTRIDKVFLSADNDFSAKIEFNPGGSILFKHDPMVDVFPWMESLIVVFALIVLLGFVLYRQISVKHLNIQAREIEA